MMTTPTYCSNATDIARSADTSYSCQSIITKLCDDLASSLRRPSGRTLRLLDKALSYLTPFESPRASVASPSERHDLLTLLQVHTDILSPYIDTDKIRNNLLH